MRGAFVFLLLLGGCYTRHIDGIGDVGWRTEMYTIYHHVPVKDNPTTAIEWQAKANAECVDILVNLRLPDSNFIWKFPKDQTGCLFDFYHNECICEGPPSFPNEPMRWPRYARFNTSGKYRLIQLGF